MYNKQKKFKSVAATAVAEAAIQKKHDPEATADTSNQQLRDYIMSVVQMVGKTKAAGTIAANPPTPAVTINSILGRIQK